MSQRKVGHIGEEANAFGARGEVRDQREGVQKAPLIRMILDADQIQPHLVGEPNQLDQLRIVVCERSGKEPELDVASVISHGLGRH
jgi:hypothetical protein